MPIKKEIDQRNIIQNTPTFFKEKSEEDLNTTNICSNKSFDNFSTIQLISLTLDDIITKNEAENRENNEVNYEESPFVNVKIPKISIEDYLNRIQKYSNLEDSTLVIALIYIDRLLENQNIILSKYNVFRILLTAVLLAIKYNEDEIYDNSFFAKIFGVTIKELNKLENEFLDLIEFKLFISRKKFQLYYNRIFDTNI